MSRKKDLYIVFDTETTGTLAEPLVFDLGWVVCDKNGGIVASYHYGIEEIFTNSYLMSTAYYAKNFASYLEDIGNGEFSVVPFWYAVNQFENCIRRYNIKAICAYNEKFDERAMQKTCGFLYGFENWLSFPIKRICILCAACDVLYGKKYIETCRKNNWVTPKGNPSCTAQTGFRYITGEEEFLERHKGLDDCRAEAEILAAVFRQRKKFDGTPRYSPWFQVYKKERRGGKNG